MAVQSMREQTFQVNGAQLFNALPVYLRNIRNCPLEDFKEKLDEYLQKVSDEPKMTGLIPTACTADATPSNSILDKSRRLLARHGS